MVSLRALHLEALSQKLAAGPSVLGLDRERSRTQRRAQGAFFTPMPLVHFLVEEALDAWFSTNDLEWHADGYPQIRILDPAAGDGRFLEYASRSLLRRALQATRSHQDQSEVLAAAIRRHCLVAIERDEDYARSITRALGEGAQVHCEEALLSGVVADASIDLVIGNPPYLRSIQLGLVDGAVGISHAQRAL